MLNVIKKAVRSVTAAVAGAVALCSLPSQAVAFETINEAAARLLGGAVGGDEIRRIDNDDGTVDLVHIFTNTVTSSLTFPDKLFLKPNSMRILLVGGGGSGGSNCGGGGGAGGLIYLENREIVSGEMTVTVGDGGPAPTKNDSAEAHGKDGYASYLTIGEETFKAEGGGGGGCYGSKAGNSGGSGGGGCSTGGSGTTGQGNAGGGGNNNNIGGGGGGAKNSGSSGSGNGGTGGAGLEYDISGESKSYAGGGGGAATTADAHIAGGAGGGGKGADSGKNGSVGEPNTGGGGGGGAGGGTNRGYGAAGGSGVAIIRYTVPFSGAEMQWVENGDRDELVLKFTDTDSVGTFTLPSAVEAWVLAVGGGGAGANPGGATTSQGGAGGGGAGGFVEKESVVLTSGTYSVTVGAGGVSPDSQGAGGNGSPSYVQLGGVDVTGLRALGGGGGGIAAATSFPAGSGGSGGGGSKALNGGSGTDGQGNAGGNGNGVNRSGAGGGGAGGVGTNTVSITRGGAGGIGKVSYITGSDSEVWYAGGGGGGSRTGKGGTGGDGGGGVDAAPEHAVSGTNGTGGGGGGGRLNGKGGNGGSGVVIVRIRCVMPEKPENITVNWTGSEIVAFSGSDYYTIRDEDGNVVEKAAAISAGTYKWRATPNVPFTWRDGTQEEVLFTLTIEPPELRVRSFQLIGWQKGEEHNEPELVLEDTNRNEVNVSGITYFWGRSADGAAGAINPWENSVPTDAGEYLIKAAIPDGDDYSAPSEVPSTKFKVWEYSPHDMEASDIDEQLGFRTDIDVPVDAAVVCITIRENSPMGFRYRDALPDGSDIRFTDDVGNLLPFVKDSWNTNGDSVFLVKAPATGSIHMWWGLIDGTTVDKLGEPDTNIGGGEEKDAADPLGPAYQKPNVTLENHWVVAPSLEYTVWDEGKSAPNIKPGTPAYDAVPATYKYSINGGVGGAFPTVAGDYEIVFTVDAGSNTPNGTKSWTALTYKISFSIITSSPTDDLSGTAGSATLSGRVLILEDYGTDEITGQKYKTDWKHLNDDKLIASLFPNCVTGSVHRLDVETPITELCGATNLWYMTNIYLGNNFAPSPLDKAERNLLPHASPSAANAANLMMRNFLNAAVYSPCYTNGIGTIYFDAVNGWTKGVNDGGYKIVLEVVKGDVAIPREGVEVDSLPWERVDMIPLKRNIDVSEGFDRQAKTQELTLDITHGESDNRSFYRVYAPLDCREPIRFRIRRTSIAPDDNDHFDQRCFILLDNIIASYPAMRAELSPVGWYDVTKTGKQTLGVENAWSVPFPATGEEVSPRAKVEFYTNPGKTDADPSTFITGATLKYRWRYLDQKTNEWQTTALNSSTLEAVNAITMPKYVGDIEFYYHMRLNAPFYSYKDYTGQDLGVLGYSENISEMENHCDTAEWFIRTREGKSDYEKFTVLVRESDPAEDTEDSEPAMQEIPMDLCGNHNWRGCLRTPTNRLSSVWFQIRGENKQIPGATEWATNITCWTVGDSCAVPISSTASQSDTNVWTEVARDGITGYILFQFDDNSGAITIVHADYQNFGTWDDAAGGMFVGTKTELSDKTGPGTASGVSAEKQTFTDNFAGWKEMDATFDDWYFPDTSWISMTNMGNHTSYKWFSQDTSGAWSVGPGRWVSKLYRDDTAGTGVALQIAGQGSGYVDLVGDTADMPRGIESLNFNARIAQGIAWEDISYYDAPYPSSMSNYCFTARAAFDRDGNSNFRGNASLSIVSNYRPGIGCYEFRVEQYKANNDGSVNNLSQVLSLYRWRNNVCTLLRQAKPNKGNIPKSANKFIPMFISVTNDANSVIIACGVRSGNNEIGASDNMPNSVDYTTLWFRDSSTQRLKNGTYGVLSTNCKGVFLRPTCYDKPCVGSQQLSESDLAMDNNFYSMSMSFPGTATDLERQTTDNREDDDNCWYTQPGRMKTFNESGSNWGLEGECGEQKIIVYTKPAGKGETTPWTELTNIVVNTFGTSSSTTAVALKPYTTQACSVRLATGGTIEDTRTDVVIDSLEIRQFAGESLATLDNSRGNSGCVPTNRKYGLTDTVTLSNFVFTTGWIKADGSNKGAIQLSAKRTPANQVSSIRSPLMDGDSDNTDVYRRGIGLGMFSFSYKNAQENVDLLLQVATNKVNISTIGSIDKVDTDNAIWTTVTNFNFEGASAADLASGVRSHYIGMHGVKGAMRLVVNPALVERVRNETDTNKFGEILITQVICRDEPDLDDQSWWGWNLRTVGADVRNVDSEKRMYIADYNQSGLSGDDSGKSLALNNSVTKNVDMNEQATYEEHVPFVQTPTFATNVVGEVSFKARRWVYTDAEDGDAAALNAEPAVVTLYGSSSGKKEDGFWTPLAVFKIESDVYTTYTYRNFGIERYKAFRLAVTGVGGANQMPDAGDLYNWGSYTPVRVLLDEILVTEAIVPRVGFKNVGAFRCREGSGNSMYDRKTVSDVPSRLEQPLVDEEWGVQCEISRTMLPDEIYWDLTNTRYRPTVTLHWYPSVAPWGYEKWKGQAAAQSSRLAMTSDYDDDHVVFRSTAQTTPPLGVIDPLTSAGVVQYMLEVVYYRGEQKDDGTWKISSTTPSTNYLTSAEWPVPEWYRPVDYNAGRDEFAAYCILDTVAPGWAWINEVNVFGSYDINTGNSDKDYQYIEIAAPVESDLTGWRLNILIPHMDDDLVSGSVITNRLATFGENSLSGKKAGNKNQASNMVFRVIASPNTVRAGALSAAQGQLDGVWSNPSNHQTEFNQDGTINFIYPFALQLIRKSGIVEHEIISLGTNYWTRATESMQILHAISNNVRFLNNILPKSNFIYTGDDDGGAANSVGVYTNAGEVTEFWNNTMTCSPGEINGGQYINPIHPTPNGASMFIYCNLDHGFKHIYQTVGEGINSEEDIVIRIPKGSQTGTNITYAVDKWYAIDKVTTNGVEIALNGNVAEAIGKGCSNNVTVVASAKVREDLVEAGIENGYQDAVLDWLTKGKTLKGDFANPDADEIKIAEFRSHPSNEWKCDLTLTEMYWFDIDPTLPSTTDPTKSGIWLQAKVSSGPTVMAPVSYGGYDDVKNIRMSVFFMITNTVTDEAWAPYVLRSRNPGMTSQDYRDGNMKWESEVLFKPSIMVDNGFVNISDRNNWVAVRWFAFDENSFRPKGHTDASGVLDEFTADIEVWDPKSPLSPGYWQGIKDWPNASMFLKWNLGTGMTYPSNVEILKPESIYNIH